MFRLFLASFVILFIKSEFFRLNMSLSFIEYARSPSDTHIFMLIWMYVIKNRFFFSRLDRETESNTEWNKKNIANKIHMHALNLSFARESKSRLRNSDCASMRSVRRWECFWWDWSCCKWHGCGGLCVFQIYMLKALSSSLTLSLSQSKTSRIKIVNGEEREYILYISVFSLCFIFHWDVCQLANHWQTFRERCAHTGRLLLISKCVLFFVRFIFIRAMTSTTTVQCGSAFIRNKLVARFSMPTILHNSRLVRDTSRNIPKEKETLSQEREEKKNTEKSKYWMCDECAHLK